MHQHHASERIEQAAIRIRGRIFTGISHRVAVWMAARRLRLSTPTVWRHADQGFVTAFGRFVSRRTAWHLAVASGQVNQYEAGRRALFDEDLRPSRRR